MRREGWGRVRFANSNFVAFLLAMACCALTGERAAPADVLDDWNDAVLQAIRAENTAPPLAARNLALLHLAVEHALRSVPPTHPPAPRVRPGHPSEWLAAAAHAAAFGVATVLFPSQRAPFENLWQAHQTKLVLGPERTNAWAAGFATARAWLDERAADGAQTSVTYIPSARPGAWRRTLPYFRPPELPHWGCVKPFVMERCGQFRPPPPPALDSRRYAIDFNEVKRLGGRFSDVRTADETDIARFWSDFTGTVTPPGHWNQIARALAEARGLDLAEKSRLLALVNVALADAGIAAWEAKFHYNFWRPVTAIHRAADDGNPATEAEPEWQPLLIAPAFPEYVSGHSMFSGAAAEVLTRFFGTDEVAVTVRSDTLPGVQRRYSSLSALVQEVGRSRVLGGIHFPSADEQGRAAGRLVGAWVMEHGQLFGCSSWAGRAR